MPESASAMRRHHKHTCSLEARQVSRRHHTKRVGRHRRLSHCLALQEMVWLGQNLVLATSLRYVLFSPRTKACTELFSVSPAAPPPTMVQSVPSADEAILLMVRHPSAHAPAFSPHFLKTLRCPHLWQRFTEHMPSIPSEASQVTFWPDGVQMCIWQLAASPLHLARFGAGSGWNRHRQQGAPHAQRAGVPFHPVCAGGVRHLRAGGMRRRPARIRQSHLSMGSEPALSWGCEDGSWAAAVLCPECQRVLRPHRGLQKGVTASTQKSSLIQTLLPTEHIKCHSTSSVVSKDDTKGPPAPHSELYHTPYSLRSPTSSTGMFCRYGCCSP